MAAAIKPSVVLDTWILAEGQQGPFTVNVAFGQSFPKIGYEPRDTRLARPWSQALNGSVMIINLYIVPQ